MKACGHRGGFLTVPVMAVLAVAATACADRPTEPLGAVGEAELVNAHFSVVPPFVGCVDGETAHGAVYEICLPFLWSGDVIVWAHGYADPGAALAIPTDEVEGEALRDIVLAIGYAYVGTSYRKNGLVAEVAVNDLDDVLREFRKLAGDAGYAYLAGASEGSLTAVLSMERAVPRFDGALALCGPIGDFRAQIDHFGDVRVLFDYFFAGILPGTAIEVPAMLMQDWETNYDPAVRAALNASPLATVQLLTVAQIPVDPTDPLAVGETVTDLLWYNVFATNDARQRLHGNPYDNRTRQYSGSFNDALLNMMVQRFDADPVALVTMGAFFETGGGLRWPVVALHTLGDAIVPFWHLPAYHAKTAAAGTAFRLDAFPVPSYGHCNFTKPEVLAAFALLVQRVTDGSAVLLASAFDSEAQEQKFLDLAYQHGARPRIARPDAASMFR